jgi:hypothetical protein
MQTFLIAANVDQRSFNRLLRAESRCAFGEACDICGEGVEGTTTAATATAAATAAAAAAAAASASASASASATAAAAAADAVAAALVVPSDGCVRFAIFKNSTEGSEDTACGFTH